MDVVEFAPDQPTIVEELVRIWRAVLRRDSLQADSDFLDNGGTSLTALRILAYLREDLGRDVDIALILENPTPVALAEVVRTAAQWDDDI
jgi:aryl carrier-like protein